MNYCKYHPLEGATHYCRACHIYQCDRCANEEQHKEGVRCFRCGTAVEFLGSSNKVEPFWRRLPEAFRYPLNGNSMTLIVGCAVLSLLALLISSLVIAAIILYLLAAGTMLKYSFNCLERTALGEMKAPDVLGAYQGGVRLLLKLFLMVVLLAFIVGFLMHFLGTGLGGILLVVAIISFPAILIRFAQTESILEALNPAAAIALMKAVGLSYGLLIAFLLIMMGSVEVLHELIGSIFPAGAYFFQMIVSNYYTIVMFHIMGYMLFQYQDQLGYTARADDDIYERTEVERYAARIDVHLKEGDYEQVVNLYWKAFKLFPQENQFYDRYFEFLVACKKAPLMQDFGTDYLNFLIQKKRLDKLTTIYKQILSIAPEFVPSLPEVRFQLAQSLMRLGDLKMAVKLLNAMHKHFPEFKKLPEAYLLMAEALDGLPNMKDHAEKCRKWVEQYKSKAELERANAAALELSAQANIKPATAPQARRAPPPTQLSGIKLELVPIEKES